MIAAGMCFWFRRHYVGDDQVDSASARGVLAAGKWTYGQGGWMPVQCIATDSGVLGLLHLPDEMREDRLWVVIHGAAADCFDGLIFAVSARLAGLGRRAAAVNLSARGLGRYDRSLRRFAGWPWVSIEDSVAEVLDLIRRCGGQPNIVTLVGHSWGAIVAAAAADHPSVQSTVLVSPMVSGQAMLSSLMGAELDQRLDLARQLVMSGRGADQVPTVGRADISAVSAATLLELADDTRNDLLASLAASEKDFTVVCGGREHAALRAFAASMPKVLNRGMTIEIDGAGHFYRGKEAELVSAILRDADCDDYHGDRPKRSAIRSGGAIHGASTGGSKTGG
jgi:pimeloyl-ACP methyl ester carboxylesterase